MKTAAALLLLASSVGAQALPAFPEAQGGGAASVGGRGGSVIEVTNLADTGAGSLRACIQASGARNCIFRVGGVINVVGDLRIGNPYLTISGQTAPGGGIKLAGKGAVMWINTHDVVVRYISYDGNSAQNGPSDGSVSFDAGSGTTYNVVFDHVSGFHVTNKQLIVLCNDAGPVKDVTFQWSLTYKPDKNHPVGPMADATTCQAKTVTNIDYHHNFFADTSHRLPLFNVKSGRWVNNLVYNWDWFAGLWQGGTTPDLIGNKYVAGNMNQGDNGGHPHPLEFTSTQSTDDTSHSMPGPPSIFLSGNQGPQGTDVSITGKVDSEGGPETGPVPSTWFRSTPLADPPFPIIPASASSLDNLLLPLVGNSQQLNCDGTLSARRQIEDTNIINEYVNKAPPGSLWTAPAGYVTAPVANGTACTETLHDGLPDQWKTANGLSTTDPNLYKEITSDGYTVLERYNNGNGAAPPPTTVKCSPTATSNNCPSGTSVTTISGANVRNQPVNGVPGTIIGTQPAGAAGTTVGNPLPASAGSTFQWFNVNFTTGVSGWVGGDNLQTGSAPPPAVTGVTVTCPASVTVGDTINCTASVAPANASQAVTWTPTLPYKTTAAGPMNIKATSVQDTTKSGNATVQVNASSNCPTSGSSPVTITSGGFTFKGTCSWTMDYTTGVMTITGCQ